MIEGWIPCRLFLNLDINACAALMIFLVFEEGGFCLGLRLWIFLLLLL